MCIDPPQRGQVQVMEFESEGTAGSRGFVVMASNCWISFKDGPRRLFARKPNWRMRTKPSGRTCCAKRRRNPCAAH